MQARFFIYARKSTDDLSRQIRSIEDQIAELRTLARKEDLAVVETFIEKQTAKEPGRPIFDEMLRRIEAGEANGILAWHPDRLSRNSVDSGRLIFMLDRKRLVHLRFPLFPFDPSAVGRMMLGFLFTQSKYYVDNLSENITRGKRQKVARGVWPQRTPVGYFNDPKSRMIAVDPVRGPLVATAFKLFATGSYNLDRITDEMARLGLVDKLGEPVSRATWHRVLRNPFYTGMFIYDGDLHSGKHEALVSTAIFDRVQKVIARRSKPRAPRLKPYLYRGVFRCGECGCFITTETQKGNNYLRCTKRVKRDCTQPFLRESLVADQITAALYTLALPDDIADWLVESLKSREAAFSSDLQLKAAQLRIQAAAVDTKIERLTEAYLAQAIALDEYRAMRNRLVADKQLITEKIRESESATQNRFEPAIRFVHRSKQARILAETGSEEEKRDFLRNTGSNLRLSNRQLHWEPRGAWQIVAETVADQACFAHQQPAAPVRGAAGVTGETSHDRNFSIKRRE